MDMFQAGAAQSAMTVLERLGDVANILKSKPVVAAASIWRERLYMPKIWLSMYWIAMTKSCPSLSPTVRVLVI